jgi:SecD/SecF fusion protein
MFKRNLWKLTLSFILVIWAVASLIPLQDRPFDSYARSEAQARSAEFAALLKEAGERAQAGKAPSAFVALKQIARERRVDLSKFFPHLDVGDVKNLEKRNALLLDHILAESKGRLQLGLDLKGGVAFTLEVSEEAAAQIDQAERATKLSKAIEIIGTRITGRVHEGQPRGAQQRAQAGPA